MIMRHIRILLMFWIFQLLSPNLRFWKRSDAYDAREAALNDLYAILAATYETVASLKPEWTEAWDDRHTTTLPPKYERDNALPPRTIEAVREMRFARELLQRHRWRSVKQPLFADVEPPAWATLQRRLQLVSAELLAVQDAHMEQLRRDEIEWIERAIEGYDNARRYIRTAEREDEPLERQVANSAYVALHLALQLSDRLIERQQYELAKEE